MAAWCFDHRRVVGSAWLLALVAVIAASQTFGGDLSNSFSSTGAPSGRAQALLAQSFPSQAGDRAQIVVHTSGQVTSAPNARHIDRLVGAIAQLPHVTGVVGPLGPAGGHGPLVVAAKLPGRQAVAVARTLARRIARTNGVASATTAQLNRQATVLDVFGLGLAVAILVDATLIRMVLVPAIMELLGDRAWWMPRWLDRRVPRLVVDSGHS